jgi:hypothetical protein
MKLMLGPLLSAIVMWSHPGFVPPAAPAAPPPTVTDAAAAADAPSTPADAAPTPAAAAGDAATPATSAPAGDVAPGFATVPPAQVQPAPAPVAAEAPKVAHDKTGETIDEDVAVFGTSGDAFSNGGQSETLSFRILTQARYADEWYITQPRDNATDAARDIANATENDGWRMNRLFLRAVAKPRKWIQARLLVDFAELRWGNRRNTVKLAYVIVRPFQRTRVTVGYFKRSYSLLELLPIADFEFADVGPTDEVIKELGFGGRDMGALVQVEPLPTKRWLNVSVGVFAGDSEGRFATVAGVVTGRLESRPVRRLRLGADASYRPRRTLAFAEDTADFKGVDFLDRGGAVSADVTLDIGRMELRAEGLYGKRTDMMSRYNDGTTFYLGDCPGGLCHWLAGWGLVTYRFPVGKRSALMPAFRAEWLEMNREQSSGKRTYLTGAVNYDLTPELRLLVDVTWRRIQPASQALSQLNEWITFGNRIYDLSGTRLTLQAQFRI